MLNFVQVNNSRVPIEPDYKVKFLQYQAYILGWIVFGNLADNAFDPRKILVFCEVFISIQFTILGLAGYHYIEEGN